MVPVRVTVLGDRDTPVGVFERLAGDGPGLPPGIGRGWGTLGPLVVHRMGSALHRHLARRTDDDRRFGTGSIRPGIRSRCSSRWSAAFDTPDLDGLPPLHSGLVGYLGYDAVRYVEHLPDMPPDDRGLPEMAWQAVGTLAAFDRFSPDDHPDPQRTHPRWGHLRIRRSGRPAGSSRRRPWAEAPTERRSSAAELRRRPRSDHVDDAGTSTWRRSRRRSTTSWPATHSRWCPRCGSRSPSKVDPFAVYRALRLINPSPYLFFLRLVGPVDRRLVAGVDGESTGRPGPQPPHRRHPAAWRRPCRGCCPCGGTARRPQGAGRARDAGGPGPQRPRAGSASSGPVTGGRPDGDRALQPCDAHRLRGLRDAAARMSAPSTCCGPPSRTGR